MAMKKGYVTGLETDHSSGYARVEIDGMSGKNETYRYPQGGANGPLLHMALLAALVHGFRVSMKVASDDQSAGIVRGVTILNRSNN
ncbi:MAG: hypothetical protein NXI32_17865 [bacterium]|nr:hypothetical protein [bacterium]